MKKMIVLLAGLLILTGCTSKPAVIDDLKPDCQNMLTLPLTAPFDQGFFYVSTDLSCLKFAENNEKSVYITGLTYNDDKPADEKAYFDKYTDYISPSNIYVNGNVLYYMAGYSSIDGNSFYRLYSLSLNGKVRKEIMDFQYEPVQFIVHRNTIMCIEYSDDFKSAVHIYDSEGSELPTILENGPVYHLFADNDYIFYEVQDVSTGLYRVCRYDLELEQAEVLMEADSCSMSFEYNNRLAYYKLSQPFADGVDPQDITITSDIIDLESGESLFTVTDERIGYFDDENIYTSSVKEKKMVYRVYNWDGSLKKTIVPSDSVNDESVCDDGWIRQDFSEIIHVLEGKIIAYSTRPDRYISCDTKSGVCRVIYE